MAITTNMELDLPTVSTTLGPEWASNLNTALEVVDAHDHSDGKGVKITPAGIDINDSLDADNNQLQNVKSLGLYEKASSDTTHLGSMQRVGTNLYWINSSGQAVQITNGSAVVSTGSGALTLSSPGSYPYTVTTSDAQAVLAVDTSSAARTLTLPAATNTMAVWIKDTSGNAQTNNITITPDGTDTIDGSSSSYTIETNFGSVGLISDGVSGWYVI